MKTQLILTGAMVALSGAQASAATLFGSTTDSRLISFDSATPGTLLSSVPISGLVDQFESVQGLDFRPLTGELFALGNAPGSVYRLYTINRSTGVATRIGSTDITLSGTFWGFDFNPTVDRIRVVSDAQTSLRLNPMTGAVAGTDTNLAASGIAAVGYDRNDNNAATPTTLFGINVTTDSLVRIGGVDGVPSPNGGTVTAIGLLGLNVDTGFAALDIHSDGTAFATLTTSDTPSPVSLYTINLLTGAATLVGQVGDGTFGLTGMSVIPEPASAAALGLAGLLLGARRRRV